MHILHCVFNHPSKRLIAYAITSKAKCYLVNHVHRNRGFVKTEEILRHLWMTPNATPNPDLQFFPNLRMKNDLTHSILVTLLLRTTLFCVLGKKRLRVKWCDLT